ncbi:hypothetical protein [Streptomyces sp. SAS_260]|uniref:hypothetical protein n=1 Tax=Streptomyces sp. SAS_260 TaxID=3412751 RepID=UPI00403C8BC2
MTIDHDAVLSARVLLLGSGRPSRAELAGAYRVLAEVSPKVYMPKLVDAVLGLYYESRDPNTDLALAEEAAWAARRMEAEAPNRAERLRRALNAYQTALFALGRRAEGRVVCEELAEGGDSDRLASVLAEEGRFREAAELDEESARNAGGEQSFWTMVRRAANLEGAGLPDAASAVFRELLDETRHKTAEQRASLSILTWELVHFSRMRDAAGDGASGTAARREALKVLEELATTGEPKNWSCILSWWSTLFVLSGRAAEPAASPACPMPPFGTELGWSGDVRDAFQAMLPDLEREAVRLREADRLPELADVQRRIIVRAAARDGGRPYLFEERFTPCFDEGVTLARRLTGNSDRLARALTDRSMFLVAARTFEPAYADLSEAVTLLQDR